MSSHYFKVPNQIGTDVRGYQFLAHFAGQSVILLNQSVIIDFADCVFFEGSLCSILGNILTSLIERGNKISLENLTGVVRGAITRNGFLGKFVLDIQTPDLLNPTSVPYNRFSLNDESKAMSFFTSQLFEKKAMPQMSALAQKEIIRNIFEVCLNALTHGGCDFVYCCGQVYPRRSTPKAVLTFSDLGNTIKANVNNHLAKKLSGNAAIKWALTEGNTTKNQTIPGGLGLKLLQNLISLNKGSIQFISADGFITYKDGKTEEEQVEIDFPGTIITIELLLKDPNFYILTSEENESSDFF